MAKAPKHLVRLTPAARERLQGLLRRSPTTAIQQRRARILLAADVGEDRPAQTDAAIAAATAVDPRTVARVRAEFARHGLERALAGRRPAFPPRRKLSAVQEAQVLVLAQSDPPPGQARWSLRLLRHRLVELDVVETISHETVRATLKKNDLTPWRLRTWVTPPRHNAGFAALMEDVLEVYARPVDPLRPLICFDEIGKDLKADVRPSQRARPGQPARQDNEYARHGSANIFLACAPHLGWREAVVSERRTAIDVAHLLRDLAEGPFREAERLVLVTDNLNVHAPSSLYHAFPPAEARRLAVRFEWHYTPLHGSWLNLAEVELSVLTGQCLNRRIPDQDMLAAEVAAWVAARNAAAIPITWRFTLEVARVRLAHVYPVL